MAFDYKKEYKEFYLPSKKPGIVTVPPMNFVAVRGQGDPNLPDGDYKRSINLLYALSFTLKMSKMGDHRIEGYFDYVVPPLEGLWYQNGVVGVDYTRKEGFHWTAMIRLPDFITPAELDWAKAEAMRKQGLDCAGAEFFRYDEGLCVQCMHLGPYDDEPATIDAMTDFAAQEGYVTDLTSGRLHHEIYLGDPRKCAPEKLKTVIRHPLRKA